MEPIRTMAAERVCVGERSSEVIASYRFRRFAIYR